MQLAFVCLALLAVAEAKKTRDLKDVPLSYNEHLSFRGVQENGTIANFEGAGHVAAVPGVHDYVRLVPALPAGYGSLFSEQKLEKKRDWVAEIGFRVHGPAYSPLVPDVTESNKGTPKSHRGGRGFAFFLSRDGLAGKTTYSSVPDKEKAPHPEIRPFDAYNLQANEGLDDENVAFFGYQDKFNGLAVVFDTAPRSPVWLRSNPSSWSPDGTHSTGAEMRGIVSVLQGDGRTSFLDPENRVIANDEEASYLRKSFGDCEVAFRNLNGLLWARISYIDGVLKVDLDLSPHTTLSKESREYAHNCITIPDFKISASPYNIGVSALAGPNSEPDTVDIYALDTFTVSKFGTPGESDAPVQDSSKPLEGTGEEDTDTGMLHELFASQVRVIEAVDSLSRRIDNLSPVIAEAIEHSQNLVSLSKERNVNSKPEDTWDHADTIARIHQRLDAINSGGSGSGSGNAPDLSELREMLDTIRTFNENRLSALTTNVNSFSTRLTKMSDALSSLSQGVTKISETSIAWLVLVLGFPLLFGSGFVFGRVSDARRRDKKVE